MTTFNVDNTMLKDFAICEAPAIAKHVFGLRGRGEKIAADIGNVFHAALEAHFRGQDKRSVMGVFEAEYDKVIPPGEQPEEARFERNNCIKIMERYIDTKPIEQFPWEAIEFEQIRGAKLHEDAEGEIVFWAKRDMLAREKMSGLLVPVDHKTTHRLTAWWARTFRMCSQLSGYCWITGREHGQIVNRAYINGIGVSKLPDSNRKCAMHGVKYSECSAEHAEFQVYQYNRSPQLVEKWRQDAIVLAKKLRLMAKVFVDVGMLRLAFRQGAFNEQCRFCEMKEWCAVDFEPQGMEQFVVYDRWEPWTGAGAGRVDL